MANHDFENMLYVKPWVSQCLTCQITHFTIPYMSNHELHNRSPILTNSSSIIGRRGHAQAWNVTELAEAMPRHCTSCTCCCVEKITSMWWWSVYKCGNWCDAVAHRAAPPWSIRRPAPCAFLVRVGTILGSEIEPNSVKKRSQERWWHKNTHPCFDPQKPMIFHIFSHRWTRNSLRNR